MSSKQYKPMSRAEFIALSQSIFGDKFSYAKIHQYKLSNSTKIVLVCPRHGDFATTVQQHLNSPLTGGCRGCRRDKVRRDERNKRLHHLYAINGELAKLQIENGVNTGSEATTMWTDHND